MIMLSMILPGIAVTYNGEEIGMEDKSDISWEDTQDPQACNTDEDTYKTRTRDPNRTPFQWDATKNAGKCFKLTKLFSRVETIPNCRS